MITIIVIPLYIVCIIIIVIINIIKLEDNNKYKDVGGVIGFDNIIIFTNNNNNNNNNNTCEMFRNIATSLI